MTFEEIVKTTKSKTEKLDVANYTGHLAAQMNITGEGEGAFYVEFADGKVSVEPYEYFDKDVLVVADAEKLTAVLEQKAGLDSVYTEGAAEKVAELAELLKKVKKEVKKPAAAKKAPAKKLAVKKETVKKAEPKKAAVKPAAKPAVKPVAKAAVKEEKKAAVVKPTAAVKKAAVATAKKVVAKTVK